MLGLLKDSNKRMIFIVLINMLLMGFLFSSSITENLALLNVINASKYLVLLANCLLIFFILRFDKDDKNSWRIINICSLAFIIAIGLIGIRDIYFWDGINTVTRALLRMYNLYDGRMSFVYYILAFVYSIFGETEVISHLVVRIFSILSIVVMHRICMLLHNDRRIAFVISALLALNPWFFLMGKVIFMEVFLIFGTLISYYCYLRVKYNIGHRILNWIFLVASLMYTFGAKEYGFFMIAVIFFAFVLDAAKNVQLRKRLLNSKVFIICFIGVLIGIILVAVHVLIPYLQNLFTVPIPPGGVITVIPFNEYLRGHKLNLMSWLFPHQLRLLMNIGLFFLAIISLLKCKSAIYLISLAGLAFADYIIASTLHTFIIYGPGSFVYFYQFSIWNFQRAVLVAIIIIAIVGLIRKKIEISLGGEKLLWLAWAILPILAFSAVSNVQPRAVGFFGQVDFRYTMLVIVPILLLAGSFLKENIPDKENEHDFWLKNNLLNLEKSGFLFLSVMVAVLMYVSSIVSVNHYRHMRASVENVRDGYNHFLESGANVMYSHWYTFLPSTLTRVPIIDTGIFRWSENNISIRDISDIWHASDRTDENAFVLLRHNWIQNARLLGFVEEGVISRSVLMFNPFRPTPFFFDSPPVFLYSYDSHAEFIQIGELININSELFERVRRSGWWHVENWDGQYVRWMAQEAALSVLSEEVFTHLEVYVHSIYNQTLSLYVNDILVDSVELEPGRGVYRFALPDYALWHAKGERITIRFVCKEYFIASDSRELSLAFFNILFS